MRKIVITECLFCLVIPGLWAATPSIAIMDLTPKVGFVKSEAEQFTDIMRFNFVKLNKYNVLERSQMNQILTEQQFAMCDLSENTDSAIKVGKLVAADYILVGSIGKLLGQISINVRVINVSSGKIEAADSIMTQEDELLADLGTMCSNLASGGITTAEAAPENNTAAPGAAQTDQQPPEFSRNEIGLGGGYATFWGGIA
jgi:curli biogenesis system outer membrane secretion channel CsgG